MSEEREDVECVRRLGRGDADALAALFRRHHRSIYRFAVQMTGSRSAADDITQDVFVELARGCRGYDSTKGTVSTYLYGIARHITRRFERRMRPLAEVDIDALGADDRPAAPHADPVESLAVARRRADLRRAILALPRHYREAVVLCGLHELSYESAARIARCPVGTIRSRLSRARAMLIDRCRALDRNVREAANDRGTTKTHGTKKTDAGLWTLRRERMLGPE